MASVMALILIHTLLSSLWNCSMKCAEDPQFLPSISIATGSGPWSTFWAMPWQLESSLTCARKISRSARLERYKHFWIICPCQGNVKRLFPTESSQSWRNKPKCNRCRDWTVSYSSGVRGVKTWCLTADSGSLHLGQDSLSSFLRVGGSEVGAVNGVTG